MDETFLQDLAVPENTPDYAILEYQENHLLLDCRVRKSPNAFCSAYTVERMSLFTRKEDGLPLPIRLHGIHRSRIGGTLYKTTLPEIVALDKSRQNGLLFERKAIDVLVPTIKLIGKRRRREIQELPVQVWFYKAISDVWEERLLMSQQKYNVSPVDQEFKLAPKFQDNERLLNNHFRIESTQIEDFFDKPAPVHATQEITDYVRRKNFDAVQAGLARLESEHIAFDRMQTKAERNERIRNGIKSIIRWNRSP